jgi:Lon protease-like protein
MADMARLLPLFPLQLVAFPGSSIPLHIFEERYKTMVGDCERTGSEFGIVLAKEEGIVNAGCTVVVEKVLERYPDGRFDIVTRGMRRFLLVSIDQEKDWLRGEVEFFEDEDLTPVSPVLREKAWAAWREIRAAQAETGQSSHAEEPDADESLLSFHLAQTVTDLNFQSGLLRSRSEAERLKHFIEFAHEYVPRTHYIAKMKKAAPTNGSGRKPAGL